VLRRDLENKDINLVMSNVTAKLLQAEQRNISGGLIEASWLCQVAILHRGGAEEAV